MSPYAGRQPKKTPYVTRGLAQRSYKQVAAAMGLSVARVGQLEESGLTRLRRCFEMIEAGTAVDVAIEACRGPHRTTSEGEPVMDRRPARSISARVARRVAAQGLPSTATSERATADDSKALRKRITELERQLASQSPTVERVEVPVLSPEDRVAMQSAFGSIEDLLGKVFDLRSAVNALIERVNVCRTTLGKE
jgi:uncharacterized coiled-coil protein SlyX